jgi:hypothetical protein
VPLIHEPEVTAMLALKARFDGKKIVLPRAKLKAKPGMVIIIFEETSDTAKEKQVWMKTQERVFRKAWANDEDSIYDSL